MDAGRYRARLEELVVRHKVPGAALAVMAGDELAEAVAGVVNLGTGVEVTPDSVFQIGSITKVYTTTLVMKAVDEGRLGLDSPIGDLLPELSLADGQGTESITMRHLLTHTSGIDGDHFEDTGRGDEAVERYVASCARLSLIHPVGATMSYCNTGFVLAGRVIEKLAGSTWDQALRTRLLEPLGAGQTLTLPEEALRYRAAHGHVAKAGEDPHLATAWGLPRSVGPAGLICASAREVVAFARMHLDGGKAPGGVDILSPGSVAAMQEVQVQVPDGVAPPRYWGLGWMLFDWGGHRVIGHDGSTVGQQAFLRAVPEAGVIACLLTNGGKATDLFRELFGEVLEEVAGVTMPPPPSPAEAGGTADLSAYEGVFERESERVEVEARDGRLHATITETGPLADLSPEPVQEVELLPVEGPLFVTKLGDLETWTPVHFYELADGSPYLHMGGRATPKVSTGDIAHYA
jgi:CubicO group peptidase (beta-lactamase class C family)